MSLKPKLIPPIIYSTPPGFGRRAQLVRDIDYCLRTSPNHYSLFVTAPTDTYAEVLRKDVEKLSGTKRTARYKFKGARSFSAQLAEQTPGFQPAPEIQLQYVCGRILRHFRARFAFHPALDYVEHSDPSSPYRELLNETLNSMGLCHPYDVLSHQPQVHSFEHAFVADLHMFPPSFIEWLDYHVQRGMRLVATFDSDHPRSSSLNLPWECTDLTSPPPSPAVVESDDVLDTISEEVDFAISFLKSSSPPHAYIFADQDVETQFLIRAALSEHPVVATNSQSVFCSNEVLFLCTALEAVHYNRPEALETLLSFVGVNIKSARMVLGKRLTAEAILAEPTIVEDSLVDPTSSLANALSSWREPHFPTDLIDSIGDYFCSVADLNDMVYQRIAAETANLGLMVDQVYNRLTRNSYDRSREDFAPHVLSVADLNTRHVSRLFASVSNGVANEALDEFMYSISRHSSSLFISRNKETEVFSS